MRVLQLWVEHMRKAGFHVEVITTENTEPVKVRMGVPAWAGSCHTAEVDGYFIEGHVPASDVIGFWRSARTFAAWRYRGWSSAHPAWNRTAPVSHTTLWP